MIKRLTIERFKSIRELTFDPRKVNVLIGAPDTGKTNILEALAILSRLGWGRPLDQSLRLRSELGFDALFYRQFFDQPFHISLSLERARAGQLPVEVSLEARVAAADRHLDLDLHNIGHAQATFGQAPTFPVLDRLRYYAYSSSEEWVYTNGTPKGSEVVYPPHGANLLYIARHSSFVYDFLKEVVGSLDWKLRFDQALKTFRLSEVRADEILDYNLDLLSDSLKRFFFYGAILLSSKDSVLIMDEPDVFAFPPQPKTLGEMIGTDQSNQFFLTTHNPYFLAGLIGKTLAKDLALCVCHRDANGDTALKVLSDAQVAEVVEQEADVFFNLDAFLQT